MELLVGLLNVDHEILIHLAGKRHRSGGNHVEDELLSGARLETSGAGEDLRARDGLDGELGDLTDARGGHARQRGGLAAKLAGVGQAADHIGGPAASGDANNQVVLAKVYGAQVLLALGGVVLGALTRFDKSVFAAGD